ncbi:MFS transporter [Saccharothrix longispora]|uniref:MFS family arabinose efflux permease n=1 Tax=Saccharothrix longispora TaxID=33920 RepID=A0ABU1PUE7_9PSEU|nr:MFS transporter [Saccharothrix longispora]MDR6593908.1 putative MFS family arabinose efflux permease [Saccharothrix longispora]
MHARTAALAATTVAAGSSGYVVAAVLTDLAADHGVSAAAAGTTITAFALAYAVGSPLLAIATTRFGRRSVLVAALLVATVGNLGAALAPTLDLLLVARVVTACGAALATPAATAVAARLNPGRQARAMAVVTGGLTAATLLGVPAGRFVADQFGYRAAFVLTALLCAAAALVVRAAVPAVPPGPVVDVRQRLAPLADRPVQRLLAVSLLACLGTFSVYGYLGPVLGGSPSGGNLLAYGLGGVLGNAVGGVAADRWGPRPPLLVALGGCAVTMALLPWAVSGPGGAVLLFAWGALFWAFNPPLFAALVALDPDRANLLLALNASAIYAGIAGSGVLGGAVAPVVLPLVGAVITAGAVVLAATIRRPAPEIPAPRSPADDVPVRREVVG